MSFDLQRSAGEQVAPPSTPPSSLLARTSRALPRQGRLNPFPDTNDDDHHHRQLDSGALSGEQSPREAVAQARRVSRNVRRKMDLVSNRVEQIESHIDADQHGPSTTSTESSLPAAGNTALATTSDFSTPFNYNSDPDSQETSSGSGSFSNGQEQGERAVSSAPNGGVVNNIEAPQSDTQSWSPASDNENTNDEEAANNYRSAKQVANDTKWSTPIVSSVVSSTRQESSSDLGADSDGHQEAGNEQQAGRRQDTSQQSVEQQGAGEESSGAELVQNHTSQIGGGGSRFASGPITDSQSNGAPSLMGAEWNPNDNYQFFSDLNAKNHAGNQQSAANGLAFRASPNQQQTSKNKFQNMTIVNSESDLVNSFSNQQQQLQLSPPPATAGSLEAAQSGGSSTRRPSGQSQAGSSSLATAASSEQPTVRKKAGVSTYVSNYGKSSKDRFSGGSAGSKQAAEHGLMEAPASGSLGDQTYEYQNGARANESRYAMDTSNVRWPAFASSHSGAQSGLSGELSIGGAAHSSQYANSAINQLLDSNLDSSAHKPGGPATGYTLAQDDRLSERRFSSLIPNDGDNNAVLVNRHSQTGVVPSGGHLTNANAYPQLLDYLQYSAPSGGIRRASNEQRQQYPVNYNNYPMSQSEEPSGPNSSQDLKHRSSGNADDPMPNYPTQDSFAAGGGLDRNMAHSADAASTSPFGYAQASADASQAGSSQADLGGAEPGGYNGRNRSPFVGPLSSGPQDQRNFYSAFAGEQHSPNGADYSPVSYGNQPASSGQAQTSGQANSQTGSVDSVSRSSGLAGAQSDASDADRSYDQQLMYANARNSYQQQLADQMQSAATTTNSNNLRQQQQQLSLLAGLAQTPGLSQADLGAILQRYQQQQQLQSQQQQVAQLENQLNAYGASLQANYQQQQQQQLAQQQQRESSPNVYRRYTPEFYQYSRAPASSLSAAPSNQGYADTSQIAASDLMPYSTASSNFQPVYSTAASNAMDARALKATNLAIYRAAMASANKNNQQPMDQAALVSSYLAAQQGGAAGQGYSGASSAGNNYSSGLYATSAVQSPTFYEAGQQQKSSTDSASGSSELGAGRQQFLSSAGSGTPTYKRSYLNSLFKPTASSRYYYAPTILSPISLASPAAAMHSLYAPATLAAEPMSAASLSQQIYAPADPYAQHSAAIDQAAAQQYQAYAAAGGFQPAPYITEPEMAESSLSPADGSSYAPEGSTGAGSSSSASSDAAESNQSSSKSGKGLTPWSSIASLLMGAIPFGILVSFLMPTLSVAGRKKRELEFTGRNFSELLKWRPPSKVLKALISGFSQQDGLLANSSLAALNAELSKLGLFGPATGPAGPPSAATSTKYRSLAGRSASAKMTTPASAWLHQSRHLYDRSNSSNDLAGTGYQLLPSSETADSTSTTLSSPIPSTTPMPNLTPMVGNSTAAAQTNGVKAKVWKAISVLNNLIVTHAQNIKRKHRSSIMDTQWSLPLALRNTLKLENLLNIKEFRRQLATISQTNQLSKALIARHQQELLNHHQQRAQELMNSSSTEVAASKLYNITRNTGELKQPDTQTESWRTSVSQAKPATKVDEPATSSPTAHTMEPTSTTDKYPVPIERPSTRLELKASNTAAPVDLADTGRIMQDNHGGQRTPLSITLPPASQLTQTIRTEPIQVQVELTPAKLVTIGTTDQRTTVIPSAENLNSGTVRQHLEVCLNQFLCRFAVKLRKGLNNSFRSAETTARSRLNSTEMPPERLEYLTKNYIKQIINKIEADNPKVAFQGGKTDQASPDEGSIDKPEQLLDMLYKNALKNQCDLMYNCSELIQIERSLLKMKLGGL